MSRKAFVFDRNQNHSRLLAKRLEDLKQELGDRLLGIERTQNEIINSLHNGNVEFHKCASNVEICLKRHAMDETVNKVKLCENNLPSRKGDGDKILSKTDGQTVGDKGSDNVCNKCLSGKITTQNLCIGVKETSPRVGRGINLNRVQYSHGERAQHESIHGGVKTDTKSFKHVTKYVKHGIRLNKSFSTEKHQEPEDTTNDIKSFEFNEYNTNLTAFAFSRHAHQTHTVTGQAESATPKHEYWKSKIRTKVIKNYLLQDVFKRLSNTKTVIAKGSSEPKTTSSNKNMFTSHTVKQLENCRYLRMPLTMSNHSNEEMGIKDKCVMTEVDIV